MNRTIEMNEAMIAYLSYNGVREHPVLARCRTETLQLGGIAAMQISPEQGAFMALLARLVGARRVLEIGVFTGYSALSVAFALPDDGRIIACDVSEEWTARAKTYWAEAGQARKIALHLGPAARTLDGLLAAGEAGRFDMGFIDADKTAYDTYYEQLLKLVRPGGLILLDNMLWGGAVADPSNRDSDTEALRKLNAKIKSDERVDMVLLPVGDGVMMARKR